ncbi:hypothetical protein BFL35_01335 [Clavibacter michiganensis]|nr:hypothetical protein BFL35_01335 [Clavibacter michiganensis]
MRVPERGLPAHRRPVPARTTRRTIAPRRS